MTVRVSSLSYLFALTAPDRRHVVPQVPTEALAKRIRDELERQIRIYRDD